MHDAHFGLKRFIGTGSLRISFSASNEPCNTIKQHYEIQVIRNSRLIGSPYIHFGVLALVGDMHV